MKKYLSLITILFTLIIAESYGQSLRIINVSSSGFPVIKANILAFESDFNPDSISNKSIDIWENNEHIKTFEFTPPKSSVIPTSIVLVLDISASMIGYKFDILKRTAKDFIQNLPLESSELAIASFNQQVTINCDFTHSISRLSQSIDDLKPIGATDFNSAFLTQYSGAIDIARQGQFKKVIIFITDGLSEVNLNEVVSRAISDSSQISCLTIGLPISDELKYITKATGGNFYSNLRFDYEIKEAFEKIYNDVQKNTLGELKWGVPYSCVANKETLIRIGQEEFTVKYQIPDSLTGTIETTPSTINFNDVAIGKSTYKPLFIRGNNIGLNITSITNSIDSLFGCNNSIFPIKTDLNEWKQLKMRFTPNDSIYTISQYTFKNSGCPDVIVDASTGGVKKLAIINPLGGETFVRGSTIPIEWKGINKSASVNFLYQIKGQNNWIGIGAGTQYKKDWVAPILNSDIRLQGQVTNNITFSNLANSASAIIDGSEFKSAYFYSEGSKILTISTAGVIKSWNSESGELYLKFEKEHIGDIAYYPEFNRVVSLSDSTLEIFTNRNGLSVKSIPLKGKKSLTSYIHIHNKELYTSALGYSGGFWDPSLNYSITNIPGGKYLDAAITPDGEYLIGRKNSSINVLKRKPLKKWFSIRVGKDFEKAILHKTENVVVIVNRKSTLLYNLDTKAIINKFNLETFIQYTKSGLYLITADNLNTYFNSIKTGERLFSISKSNAFTLSDNGKYIVYVNSDTLSVCNLLNRKKVWSKLYDEPNQIQFFPISTKLLLIHNDSLSIVNFISKQTDMSVLAENSLINMIDIAPDEKSVLVTTPQAVAIWEIKTHFDSDTTPFFSIVIPEPEIAQNIDFDEQYINTPSEQVFLNIIKNPTNYPLIIDSIYIDDVTNYTLISTSESQLLQANSDLPVEIKFQPKTTGSLKAKLVVISSNKRYYCQLNGVGINRDFELLTPTLYFEALKLGAQIDTIIPVIKNTGTEPIVISKLNINPDNNIGFKYSHIKLPVTILAGEIFWGKIDFNPTVRGRQNAMLSLFLDSQYWINSTGLYGSANANRTVIVVGKTINVQNKTPILSQVIITELRSGKVLVKKQTDSYGEFTINLNTDLNYSITAQLDGFFSSSENINLEIPQLEDTIWVEVQLTPINQGATVRLNNIFFESSKSELLDLSKTELMRIVKLLKDNPDLLIEIHGHTDNIGAPDSNLILSKARAISVKNFLVNNGIDKNRLSIKSFGEARPIDSNNTSSGRKANRRVEIKFNS